MARFPGFVRPAAIVASIAMALAATAAGFAEPVALVPDEPQEGVLDSPQRYYAFWLPAGFAVRVTLASREFDPYLVILGPDGWIIGQNDDWGPGPDAAISWTTEEAGWHTAVITSLAGAGRGAYAVLLSLDGPAPLAGGDGARNPGGVESGAAGPVRGSAGMLVPGVVTQGVLPGGGAGDEEPSVVFTFAGEEGDVVSITMASADFDPVLRLWDPQGVEIAYNDDADDSLSAQIVARLPSSGEYTVVAGRWFAGAGEFTLRLDRLPELHEVQGRLAEEDGDPGGRVHHDYEWRALPGAAVEVWLAADFDAYLEVYDSSGALLASDDDSGGIWDARVTVGPLDGGAYRIRVTSSGGWETGAYTLRLWARTADGEPGSAAPPAALGDFDSSLAADGARSAEPVFAAGGEMTAGELASLGDVRNDVVELPHEGGTYDVWLFSEIDLDL